MDYGQFLIKKLKITMLSEYKFNIFHFSNLKS